jgi:hypothetical protein
VAQGQRQPGEPGQGAKATLGNQGHRVSEDLGGTGTQSQGRSGGTRGRESGTIWGNQGQRVRDDLGDSRVESQGRSGGTRGRESERNLVRDS